MVLKKSCVLDDFFHVFEKRQEMAAFSDIIEA